ncbi:MAG: SDR family NAD(P)-dependent oxidoreductase [Calditrichaceae bacterium]
MKDIAVITGGGTGIGKALAIELAQKHEMDVLVLGRRIKPLQETANVNSDKITYFAADVGTAAGREKICESISSNMNIKFLVHNAAILTPVESIDNLKLDEWKNHMAINVEGPLFLSKALLSKMDKARILHISSGAAHRAVAGWAAYCTSKAALFMLYQVMNTELNRRNIYVGSVRPGVVDTPMQTKLRQSDPDVFPDLSLFHQYKEDGKLIPIEIVAQFLAWILFNTKDKDFSEKEWDIYRDFSQLDEKYKR